MSGNKKPKAPKRSLEADSAFTRALGSTDYHTREAGLRALQTFLARKSDIEELDLLKLWKGIFYCFWHSDKSAVQTELAERLSEIMTQLPEQVGWLYYQTFVRTMRREWAGIDHLRLDKFMMLIRKVLAAALRQLQAHGWQQRRVARLGDFWLQEVLLPRDTLVAVGVAYHLTDLLLPELARCLQEGGAKGAAPGDATLRVLLEPFCAALAATHHPALVHRLRQGVFDPLVEEVRQEGEAAALRELDVAALAAHLFELGSNPEARARNREALYAVSGALERAAAKRPRTERQPPQAPQAVAPPQRKPQHEQQEQRAQQVAEAPAQQVQKAASSAQSGKKRRGLAAGQEAAGAALLAQQALAAAPADQAAAPAAPSAPSSSQKKRKKASRLGLAEAAQGEAPAAAVAAPAAAAGRSQEEAAPAGRGRRQSRAIPAREQELLAAAVAAVTGGGTPGGGEDGGEGTPGEGSPSKKKNVRFSLRRNLVNVIGQPPKPQDVRTPPTAKPKGSALKRDSKWDGPAGAADRLLTRAGKDRLAQFQTFMNGRSASAQAAPAPAAARPGSASKAEAGGGRRQKARRASMPPPGSFSRPRAADFF